VKVKSSIYVDTILSSLVDRMGFEIELLLKEHDIVSTTITSSPYGRFFGIIFYKVKDAG